MGIFEKTMKHYQEKCDEICKLSMELDELKDKMQQLEADITAAIDSDDTVLAEKLVNQRRDYDTKIEVKARIIKRKQEQNEDHSELIEASNKETAEFQRRINQLGGAVLEAKKAYLIQLLELAKLVNAAWDRRTQYCSMIPNIEDPASYNAQTNHFSGVSHHINWNRADDPLLLEIDPNALMILAEATKNRTNLFAGRDNSPLAQNVSISK